ncbi:MAG: ectoine synthase [Acidimicrobiales bacterium]
MIIRSLADLVGTERDVDGGTWRSRRLLLADDDMGFSVHDTVLAAGTTTEMHYRHHLEAVYCIEGRAELTDHATGETRLIEPGMLYALDANDHHTVKAIEDFRVVCVFNPPVTGHEVHDDRGGYLPAEEQLRLDRHQKNRHEQEGMVTR